MKREISSLQLTKRENSSPKPPDRFRFKSKRTMSSTPPIMILKTYRMSLMLSKDNWQNSLTWPIPTHGIMVKMLVLITSLHPMNNRKTTKTSESTRLPCKTPMKWWKRQENNWDPSSLLKKLNKLNSKEEVNNLKLLMDLEKSQQTTHQLLPRILL